MSVHPSGCDCGRYACRLRSKGISISPAATPTRRNSVPPTNDRYNGWEKGKAYEERPGGTQMPILSKDGQLIPIKKFNEQHRQGHETNRKRQQAAQP